jgi:hypothetical protein
MYSEKEVLELGRRAYKAGDTVADNPKNMS